MMLQLSVTYEQLRSARTVFGPRFQIFYTADGVFRAVALAEGFPFYMQFEADAAPATFAADFPAAMNVLSV